MTNEIADAPQRLAHRHALLLAAEQIEAFRADERAADERGNLLRRERPEPAELALGLARKLRDEIEPADQAGADDLGDLGIGPAGGDQLLQHAHVARRDVVIEIVAGPVPLLRKLERRIAEQRVLAIEQLGVEILEQRQHHPLLGAEVIVDLAERHAGRRRDVAGRRPA